MDKMEITDYKEYSSSHTKEWSSSHTNSYEIIIFRSIYCHCMQIQWQVNCIHIAGWRENKWMKKKANMKNTEKQIYITERKQMNIDTIINM